jgi:transposase
MVLTDGQGLPLATEVEAASVAEVNLIEPLLDEAVTDHVPPRLVYDKAADCDALRDRLAQRGVDLICPHRKNRVRQKKQDGRKLRRYQRRWTVERSIAWLQAFKRLVVRNEFYAHLYHGFVQLACMIICFRRL